MSEALAAGIPGARHVAFADAPHGRPIQHADRANALLLEHFDKIGPSAPLPAGNTR